MKTGARASSLGLPGRHGAIRHAVAWARKAIGQPNFQWSRHAALISALGHLGRLGEAREVLDEALRPRPDFSRSFVRDTHLIADEADFDHYIDGLEKVGVPEHPLPAD